MALAELEAVHLRLGKEMFEAFGGAMYGMDLLAAGALNRSKAHIAGFSTLIKAKNLICSGALLRLQLDTAMRFFAAFLVERPPRLCHVRLTWRESSGFEGSLG